MKLLNKLIYFFILLSESVLEIILMVKPQERGKDERHLSKKNLLAEKWKKREDRHVFCNTDSIFSFQEMILYWERNARLDHGNQKCSVWLLTPHGDLCGDNSTMLLRDMLSQQVKENVQQSEDGAAVRRQRENRSFSF